MENIFKNFFKSQKSPFISVFLLLLGVMVVLRAMISSNLVEFIKSSYFMIAIIVLGASYNSSKNPNSDHSKGTERLFIMLVSIVAVGLSFFVLLSILHATGILK